MSYSTLTVSYSSHIERNIAGRVSSLASLSSGAGLVVGSTRGNRRSF